MCRGYVALVGASRKNPIERAAERVAATPAGSWFFEHVAPRADRVLLPLTRGHLSSGGLGRVGLLKVRGARTGVERETPLVFTRDGERIVLVASRGGAPRHPAWYRNVVANPEVRFLSPGGERSYRARTAEEEERERLWRAVVGRYSGYSVYERRAAGKREIPLVVLEPIEEEE